MMRKWFPLLLTILLFSNCDSSSEDPVDDNPVQTTDDDVTGQDETPPEISISEIPEVIEVTTELTVNISDESDQVTTVVNLDGTEVFRSTQKSFVFDLNPFDYPSGPKNIEIVASDASGNENSLEETFELNRLLLRIPDPRNEVIDEFARVYYAVNDLDGNLIDYKRVEVPGSISFYADDEFEQQEITMTLYSIGKAPQSFQFLSSVSDLDAGTILPGDRSENYEQPSFQGDSNQVEISVTSNYLPTLRSHNAELASFSGFSGTYTVFYNNSPDSGEIMYSFPSSGADISEYEYIYIEDFERLTYELNDFIKPSSFRTIKLPEGGDFFGLTIEGFYSEEDYQNKRFKNLLNYREDVPNLVDNSVEVPFLEQFEVFERNLSLSFRSTKKRFSTTQKGLDPDFIVPNLDISKNGRFITTQGDYDYSKFLFSGSNYLNSGTFNLYHWFFRNRPTTAELSIPYYDFEFPPEIQEELSSKSVSFNPDEADLNNSFSAEIYRYDAPLSYKDIIFFTERFREVERANTYSLWLDLLE